MVSSFARSRDDAIARRRGRTVSSIWKRSCLKNTGMAARLLSRRNKWLLLKCIRETTVKANRGRRYVQVSRAFFQLRQIIEYKARRAGHAVMLIDPAYTSQTCPRCGMVRKTSRRKNAHLYVCANCGYRSNDDRVAAMNIRGIGYETLDQLPR